MTVTEQALLTILGIIVGVVGAVAAALAIECWVNDDFGPIGIRVHVPVATACGIGVGAILWILSNQ